MNKNPLATVLLTASLAIVTLLQGCATRDTRAVRQSDLDAWVGVPVIAVDTHPMLLTYPMGRTITDDGLEIRIYSEKMDVSNCRGGGGGLANSPQGSTLSFAGFNTYRNCISKMAGCDGIFYIRDGKVIEAKVTGQCYTDESYRPDPGYEKFLKK